MKPVHYNISASAIITGQNHSNFVEQDRNYILSTTFNVPLASNVQNTQTLDLVAGGLQYWGNARERESSVWLVDTQADVAFADSWDTLQYITFGVTFVVPPETL
jgi:hypothetical protein